MSTNNLNFLVLGIPLNDVKELKVVGDCQTIGLV
jgi:hypothetical protein